MKVISFFTFQTPTKCNAEAQNIRQKPSDSGIEWKRGVSQLQEFKRLSQLYSTGDMNARRVKNQSDLRQQISSGARAKKIVANDADREMIESRVYGGTSGNINLQQVHSAVYKDDKIDMELAASLLTKQYKPSPPPKPRTKGVIYLNERIDSPDEQKRHQVEDRPF
jgi:hypothetical protein